MTKPIVVLISGKGTNLKAIIEQCVVGNVVGVISSKPHVEGLVVAYNHSIPSCVVNPSDFLTVEQYDNTLINTISVYKPELIVLAGFMRILSPRVVKQFEGKIVNTHPSLLPAYKGLHTHRRVLEANESKHGFTIHYVDEGLDTGSIIFQVSFDILPGMDIDDLEYRIKSMEHIWYPVVIDGILQGTFHDNNEQHYYHPDYAITGEKENNREHVYLSDVNNILCWQEWSDSVLVFGNLRTCQRWFLITRNSKHLINEINIASLKIAEVGAVNTRLLDFNPAVGVA